MSRMHRRPRPAIVAGAVLLALLIASGCGSDTTHTDGPAASAATFDQALHDRLPAGILTRAPKCGGDWMNPSSTRKFPRSF